MLNEFLAYRELGAQAAKLTPRTVRIASFALCGFANFGSLAIVLGGLGGDGAGAAGRIWRGSGCGRSWRGLSGDLLDGDDRRADRPLSFLSIRVRGAKGGAARSLGAGPPVLEGAS